ncbi:uncharacterized protein LOC125651520 [Ostrea edulis]|uniref:uncharacterized protein LOC125651520 n=1 Tax=Ostrea edulis TaxID=37623 RepID=UPI002095995B|nr:uncharacterized protein LOC125651520 [Ostrea edulis]XP_048736106.1 uncharacterized protein LOC125651520 [Ostrea edulis]XP_056021038.1 uncharacterized protein LOC125651520 [Ostrea edulis]
MSDVDAKGVSVKLDADDQDTADSHNESLITDLDDVNVVCHDADDNCEDCNKESSRENKPEQVTDLDNVNTLIENESQRVCGENKFSSHVFQYELNAHTIDPDKLKIGPYSDGMENSKIMNTEEKSPVQDPDMEAVKEYVLKIINKAREIVQTESEDTGKSRTKKGNAAKPWTQRLAEIFCFRRN